MGDTKVGHFDIAEATAVELLMPPNPNGLPNSDVVVPWINGMDRDTDATAECGSSTFRRQCP